MLHLNFDIKYLILKYLHLIVDYRKKLLNIQIILELDS